MGHAHDDRLDAQFSGYVDNLLHSRDEDFTAFETETFLRRPFLRQEVLKSGSEIRSKLIYVNSPAAVDKWISSIQYMWTSIIRVVEVRVQCVDFYYSKMWYDT